MQDFWPQIQTKERRKETKYLWVCWSHFLNYNIRTIDAVFDSKQAQMSNCPLRFARENKKLLADSMRLEQVGESIIDNECQKVRNKKSKWIIMRLYQENDKLAQQLLTKQIGMRTDMDRWNTQ